MDERDEPHDEPHDEPRDEQNAYQGGTIDYGSVEPSGVPGLDAVLGGGLHAGGFMLLIGQPGSGKTVMASQIAFHHAARGQQVIFFTVQAEPPSKLLNHLRTLRFFTPAVIGRQLEFVSLQQAVEQGLDETAEQILRLAHQRHARLIVLDGFRGIWEATTSTHAIRGFVHRLANRLNLQGATLVVTSETNAHDTSYFAEATTADVVVTLQYDVVGMRGRRTLEVVKTRGVEPLLGLHFFTLDTAGAAVFPRLEARIARTLSDQAWPEVVPQRMNMPMDDPGDPADDTEAAAMSLSALPITHVSTGLPALDAILDGGLVRGTSTLVLGTLGAGKTLLGLHFAVAGSRAGEPTLIYSFRESPEQLLVHARSFSWEAELAAAQHAGLVRVVTEPPIELSADVVAHRLLALLDAYGIQRLVVDGVGELEHSIVANGFPQRTSSFFAALLHAVRVRGITTVFLRDTPEAFQPRMNLDHGPLSALAESLIWLRQRMMGGHLLRTAMVLQTRFSAHDMRPHAFAIESPEGIHFFQDAAPSAPMGHPIQRAATQEERAQGKGTESPRGRGTSSLGGGEG